MARTKKISSEELITYAKQFIIENPYIQLTIPALGKFIRSKGADIGDYLLRRDGPLKEYITTANAQEKMLAIDKIVAFHSLDVDSFLDKNSTREKLKKALYQRDQYYLEISTAAAQVFQENKVLIQKIAFLDDSIVQLKKELTTQVELEYAVKLKEKDRTIRKLKAIIEEYVYPAIANSFLQNEGILEETIEMVDTNQLETKLIKAETDLSAFRSKYVNELSMEFEE